MIGMKPHDLREDKLHFPCILDAKYDGMRGIFKDGEFWSLEDNRIPGMRLYKNWLTDWANQGIHLDGELVIPNTSFEEGCGIIRSSRLKTNAHFMVFDLPSSPRVPLVNRREWLRKFIPSVYLLSEKKIQYVPFHIIKNKKELDFWYDVYRRNGLEGIVVKQPHSHYTAGKSWDWMRKKPDNIVDATIVGYLEGTGKHSGRLGSLIVRDSNWREFKVGGGLTDSQRVAVWANRKGYLGMLVEIVYQRRTNTGSYRHPRVKRFRLDRAG